MVWSKCKWRKLVGGTEGASNDISGFMFSGRDSPGLPWENGCKRLLFLCSQIKWDCNRCSAVSLVYNSESSIVIMRTFIKRHVCLQKAAEAFDRFVWSFIGIVWLILMSSLGIIVFNYCPIDYDSFTVSCSCNHRIEKL